MEEDFDFFDGLLEENSNNNNNTGVGSASPPTTTASAAPVTTALQESAIFSSSTSPPTVELFVTPPSPPLRRRSAEERFNELVQLEDVVDPERKYEIVPLAKSLIVQYRQEPHSLYVTRKSVFIPYEENEYFQSPNFRHLLQTRLRRCSEDMANATGLAFTEHEQQQQQRRKRQRRQLKEKVFDLAMQNTLKIVYGDGGTI